MRKNDKFIDTDVLTATGLVFSNIDNIREKIGQIIESGTVIEGGWSGFVGPRKENSNEKPKVHGIYCFTTLSSEEESQYLPNILLNDNQTPRTVGLVGSIGHTTICVIWSDFVIWNGEVLRFMGDDMLEEIKHNEKHLAHLMGSISLEDMWILGNNDIIMPQITHIKEIEEHIINVDSM